MNTMQFAEEIFSELRQRHPRYHERAYIFVLAALRYVIEPLEEPRHITGRELADGARRLALERFGPMARTVLEHWGIHSTEDLGEIVFALVDCGVLIKREEDRPEDFEDIYDFEDAFEAEYPWGANL